MAVAFAIWFTTALVVGFAKMPIAFAASAPTIVTHKYDGLLNGARQTQSGEGDNRITRSLLLRIDAQMETLLTERLARNGMTGGSDVIRITGAGPNASWLR